MYQLQYIALGTGGIAACTRGTSGAASPFSREEVTERISQLSENTLGQTGTTSQGVILGGFEPFHFRELVQVLSELRDGQKYSVDRIGLQTDGGALSVVSNAFGSIDAGVTLFEVFLRGGDEHLHDALTSPKGSFHLAQEGIATVQKASNELKKPVFITGVVAMCRHNSKHLPSIVSAFVRLGVDAIRVEAQNGTPLDQILIAQSYEIATTAGILLFGDGCTRIESARLYRIESGESR